MATVSNLVCLLRGANSASNSVAMLLFSFLGFVVDGFERDRPRALICGLFVEGATVKLVSPLLDVSMVLGSRFEAEEGEEDDEAKEEDSD